VRWFRNNIRQGSRLALFALVINLGLSFGHFHAIDGKHAEGNLLSVLASAPSDTGRTQGHHGDTGADYLCPICAAVSAMANALISAPPALAVRFENTSFAQPVVSQLSCARRSIAAFQSRGPPIS
jgi:hypothetical protein